jgi:hypothetical protein
MLQRRLPDSGSGNGYLYRNPALAADRQAVRQDVPSNDEINFIMFDCESWYHKEARPWKLCPLIPRLILKPREVYMIKYFRLVHYVMSPSYYRSFDDLDRVWSACARFEKVDNKDVPLPAWPGADLLDVVAINEQVAWDLVQS